VEITRWQWVYKGRIDANHDNYTVGYVGWYEFLLPPHEVHRYAKRREAVVGVRTWCDERAMVTMSVGNVILIRHESDAFEFRMVHC
jgi:hypothetical protein